LALLVKGGESCQASFATTTSLPGKGPRSKLYGKTNLERPLHIQCSYPTRPKIKIITVYEPDPEEWIEFKRRRQ